MTTLSEIRQYYHVISQAVKLDPTASLPAKTYIKHIEALAGAYNEAVNINRKQSKEIRDFLAQELAAGDR